MLLELSIRNFGLIEELAIRFGPGLNVLTGETGAGKSMIVGALAAVLGGRIGAEEVRAGTREAVLEAELDGAGKALELLGDVGVPGSSDEAGSGGVILRREISTSGRSRARVNGMQVPVTVLHEIGGCLAELHGQHEHQSLLRPERHIGLLDLFGKTDLFETKQCHKDTYARLRAVEKQVTDLRAGAEDLARQSEILRFQIDEIEGSGLSPGEDALLESERLVLLNAERLAMETQAAYSALIEGDSGQVPVTDVLAQISSSLSSAGRIDPFLAEKSELLKGILAKLREVGRELRSYRERLEPDAGRLSRVEERLEHIRRLISKHGGRTIEELLSWRDHEREELRLIEDGELHLDSLEKKRAGLQEELGRLTGILTGIRTRLAQEVGERVEEELARLGMGGTRFSVALAPLETCQADGADRVEFMIAPNPGEDLKPLSRIASGGELSRIMLALRTVLAGGDEARTLVFDEVDAGIGGRAAQAVADRLKRLSRGAQVICITHLPHIACMADVHHAIRKEFSSQRTRITCEALDAEGRVLELARMLGGARLTPATINHAREMLSLAGTH